MAPRNQRNLAFWGINQIEDVYVMRFTVEGAETTTNQRSQMTSVRWHPKINVNLKGIHLQFKHAK